jgi:hypothetical protein
MTLEFLGRERSGSRLEIQLMLPHLKDKRADLHSREPELPYLLGAVDEFRISDTSDLAMHFCLS